jgi:hypothetical protein
VFRSIFQLLSLALQSGLIFLGYLRLFVITAIAISKEESHFAATVSSSPRRAFFVYREQSAL